MVEETKVLMVTTQEIINDINDGGKKCSYRNYRLLCDSFGEDNVFLVMCTNECGDSSDKVIRVLAYKGWVNRIINMVTGTISTSYDGECKILGLIREENVNIVFLDRTIQGRLAEKIRETKNEIKIWSFSHNIEYNYFRNKFKKNIILKKIVGIIIGESEKRQLRETDQLFVLTDRDAEANKNRYKIGSIILPMTFVDIYDQSKIEKNIIGLEKELLFIGTMFGPNYDGIKWFVNEIMTELKEWRLTIVGKNFEKKRDELQRENVDVVGTVDDLEPYYYSSNVMVMPIFYGDGQKIKTAEAMMYGKIILATDEALEGYSVENVEGILRCNSKEDFLNSINKLDKMNLDLCTKSVRNLFEKEYSYEGIMAKTREIFINIK